MFDPLSTNAVASADREWLERGFVIFFEAWIVSRIILGKKTLRVEDARFHPIVGVIVDILEVDTNDSLYTP